MPPTPGTQLGPYTLAEKLGEGGMGEVYRATDTKLKRDVAIKFLPEAFTRDPERLARFEREAQVLAQLQHPNIASIYGIEEGDGIRALVMELIEGPTLGERMEAGRIPRDEVLDIALQIAEALEEAHAKGIVHRDLKPANVKLAPDGRVKVLDFGLAKALDPASDAAGGAGKSALANSPTLTSAGTQLGVILGTASYMSPEQARGIAVDRRADIWAFGVVLYEMLVGRALFEGEMVSDVLACVLKSEIDFDAIPGDTPPAIRRLLRRCLERNPKNRLHDVADARIVIQEVIAGDDDETATAAMQARPRSTAAALLPWLVAGAALAALGVSLLQRPSNTETTTPGSHALALSPPVGGQLAIGSNAGWGALSPDGKRIVVRANTKEGTGLWVRSLDRKEGRLLPNTEDGFYPFWSPDSRWIAFFNRGLLQKVEVEGGLPEKICVAPWGRGGSWSESGRIVLTPLGGGAIHVVDAAGGETRPVTRLDADTGEDAHYWPVWLPDGERFLYFIRSGQRENQGIYLGRVPAEGVDERRERLVASTSSGLFVPAAAAGGAPTLLWAQDGVLLARTLDLESGALTGPTSRIAEGVRVLASQRAVMASVSNNGILTWASSRFGRDRVAIYSRDGIRRSLIGKLEGRMYQPYSSPDGRLLSIVVVEGGQGDIWIYNREDDVVHALTSTAIYEENVVWSPDSQEIVMRGGGTEWDEYLRVRADGSDTPRMLFGNEIEGRKIPSTYAWLPGDWLVVEIRLEDGTGDVGVVPLDDPSRLFDLIITDGDQYSVVASPSGDALAYLSDESGKEETYLVSLTTQDGRPSVGPDRQRVAVNDVLAMEWGLDGNELFVMTTANRLLALPVERRGGRIRLGDPQELFELPEARQTPRFGVSPDGQEFLFLVDPEAQYQTLSVLMNWPSRIGER